MFVFSWEGVGWGLDLARWRSTDAVRLQESEAAGMSSLKVELLTIGSGGVLSTAVAQVARFWCLGLTLVWRWGLGDVLGVTIGPTTGNRWGCPGCIYSV
jgi:hypothetical protein